MGIVPDMDLLPVFLDLRDRQVLVVGGGAIAMRKIELLLAAQAKVRIVAPSLGSPLAVAWDATRIEYQAATFEPRHLDGVVFVIAATDQSAVNDAVARAAGARGLFVNVVDDAGRSTAVMPAIVDRSPLLVAVGTAGRSPTLARRLRAQLEAWLPARLGSLARFAGEHRERVRQALPDLDRRRRFWDGFFTGPGSAAVLAGNDADAARLLSEQLQQMAQAHTTQPDTSTGEVYLIGAGPGDPDLLTVRALQLLQQADVVLFDRLVSEPVLQRVRRDALRIDVGKQSGNHRVTQERIHALLLEHARQGKRVARLKGGDPFIFGRGGEEVDLLRQAGIPVISVPGVTAALGAAAAASLPLTQRGIAPSVTFVTATGDGAADLNWHALAQPLQTVVFYMGVAQLPRIVEHLRAEGAPADRPAAIVERATLPGQRVMAGTLATIAQVAQRAQVVAPALLIVGEVASRAVQTAALAQSQFVAGVSQP
ncbi:MAG TPA: siroheme synthase CysG [Steroidobacteraceae bacterium]|jgi:uroporphyrin-III C-methyltransferase/precorrin-2 dehydrogenase/sirohydrochlorin ferrochelatase|nr:siroheme synthase CysG [Steroidobacteraceae bacterium]